MADIDTTIQPRQVSERILRPPSILHEPMTERLHRNQIVIAARDTQAGDDVSIFVRLRFTTICQPAGDSARVEVAQFSELATVDHSRKTLNRQRDVCGGVAFRFQQRTEVFNVLG